ncbi:hypothetical protein ABZ135_13385 [Streptomyces sp. NPDC006339]|uniref:hypothetical protein n=1 Tax=Streptomyces sp. NPDC006339 TaxID=3156755 RepID=UPI0033B83880
MPHPHPHPYRSEPNLGEQLSVLDRLSVLPFPPEESRPGASGQWGGPGFHLAVLRESQDFWEDRSTEIVDAAEAELDADFAALTAVLTERWGAPETVDLWPPDPEQDPDPGVAAREPLGFLSGVAGSVRVWRLPESARWVGLALGQADPEWPIQLLAAIGEGPVRPI